MNNAPSALRSTPGPFLGSDDQLADQIRVRASPMKVPSVRHQRGMFCDIKNLWILGNHSNQTSCVIPLRQELSILPVSPPKYANA